MRSTGTRAGDPQVSPSGFERGTPSRRDSRPHLGWLRCRLRAEARAFPATREIHGARDAPRRSGGSMAAATIPAATLVEV
jgi:hypothetical protein